MLTKGRSQSFCLAFKMIVNGITFIYHEIHMLWFMVIWLYGLWLYDMVYLIHFWRLLNVSWI